MRAGIKSATTAPFAGPILPGSPARQRQHSHKARCAKIAKFYSEGKSLLRTNVGLLVSIPNPSPSPPPRRQKNPRTNQAHPSTEPLYKPPPDSHHHDADENRMSEAAG